MKLSNHFISCILLAFLARSASSQCCDFSSSYQCDWEFMNDAWHIAPLDQPDTVPDYPGFVPFDPAYAWIQDQSGAMKTVDLITISSPSTGFHFDYYFNSPSPSQNDFLKVMFYPIDGDLGGIEIVSITKAQDKWSHHNAVCDNTNDFCCGSKDAFPCAGKVEIVASLNTEGNLGLIGLDNLCGDGEITTPTFDTSSPLPFTSTAAPITTSQPSTATTQETTKSPITLPPPHGGDTCCQFENDVCDFTSDTYWYWSVDLSPPLTIPNSEGGYLWTNTDGSYVETEIPNNITAETSFSVSYFISNPGDFLNFYFDNGGSLYLAGTLDYVDGNWHTAWVQAGSYCPIGLTCYGTLQFQFFGVGIAAIDTTEIDGACGGTFPCCYFDEPNFCNFEFSYPQEWLWSGNSTPQFNVPVPPSTYDYIYYETFDYVGPAAYSTLSSQLLLIKRTSVFKATIYVSTPNGEDGLDDLQFNFREDSTQITTALDFAKTTYSNWIVDVEFQCQSIHGDCCQTSPGDDCYGTLEITAFVEENGGTVFYGIDSIYIDDKCQPLPPTTVSPTTTPTTTTTSTTTTPTTTTPTTTTPTTTTPTTTTPTTTTPTTTTPTTTTPTTTTPTTTTPTTTTPTTTTPTTTTPTTTTPTTTTPTTTTPTTTTPTTTTPTTTTPTTTTPTTTTPPITLPPPNGGDTCCHFDTDVCGFYSNFVEWNWSQEEPPTTPIPNADNDYLWTATDGSVLQTQALTIAPETSFSMSYFISGPSDQLTLYFIDDAGNSQFVTSLNFTNGAWLFAYVQAFKWCFASSCNGHFEVRSSGSDVSAIDDTEINGGCGGSFPCCYFDSLNICDFEDDYTGLWKWSGSSTPLYPVPPPPSNSAFVYFEEQEYTGPEENATLSSNRIYINDNTAFTASVYIETPEGDAGEDALYFLFTEESTGITTVMDFGKSTSGRWLTTTFYCNGLHGDCCQGASACYGNLQIQGHVQQNGGTVFYGIDSIEIDNQCPTFPGYGKSFLN